jgi:hypothetical protein
MDQEWEVQLIFLAQITSQIKTLSLETVHYKSSTD